MKTIIGSVFAGVTCGLICLLFFGTAIAGDQITESGPWEKAAVNFGGFISSNNTSFRLGNGAGVDIDVEKLLDLEQTNTVFRFPWSGGIRLVELQELKDISNFVY